MCSLECRRKRLGFSSNAADAQFTLLSRAQLIVLSFSVICPHPLSGGLQASTRRSDAGSARAVCELKSTDPPTLDGSCSKLVVKRTQVVLRMRRQAAPLSIRQQASKKRGINEP